MPSLALSAEGQAAAASINPFGLDLCRQLSKRGGNVIISPYSLQRGLVLAYAGAEGDTRAEMAKVLYYPENQEALLESFAELAKTLNAAPLVSLLVANRLFVDEGITIKPRYLETLESAFDTPVTTADLQAPSAAIGINQWVEGVTKGQIPMLLPTDGFDQHSRLLVINALYLNGPWATPFDPLQTKPRSFYSGSEVSKVPTMQRELTGTYWKTPEFTAVGIPLVAKEFQMLVLLSPSPTGLPGLEARLTPKILAQCGTMQERLLLLSLPKFQAAQPTLTIGAVLMEMGMKQAFDMPPGSANFAGIAERHPQNYPFLSNVFHKAMFSASETGVIAAVVTGTSFGVGAAPPPVTVVNVDRPFFFAIQHKPSGACLIMGRIEKL